MTTRLILIRHGQTPSNVLGLLDTAVPGPGLTDLGRQQAEAVAVALRDERIDRVIASVQLRAQLTARPLAEARGLPVLVADGLREVAAGDWEMADDATSVHGYVGRLGSWMTGASDDPTPGPNGESGTQVLQRYDRAIDAAFADGAATVAAVSHGAAIRFWAGVRAANISDDFGADNPLHNTGVVVLSRAARTRPWQVESWMGDAIGGGSLDDPAGEGPAADPVDPAASDRRADATDG